MVYDLGTQASHIEVSVRGLFPLSFFFIRSNILRSNGLIFNCFFFNNRFRRFVLEPNNFNVYSKPTHRANNQTIEKGSNDALHILIFNEWRWWSIADTQCVSWVIVVDRVSLRATNLCLCEYMSMCACVPVRVSLCSQFHTFETRFFLIQIDDRFWQRLLAKINHHSEYFFCSLSKWGTVCGLKNVDVVT